MRFAVVGAGGVGAYFGGLLANAGHDVGYVARGRQLEALRSGPLTIQCCDLGEMKVKVRAEARAEDLGPADVVFFAVKTYQTEEALEHVKPLVGPDTMVLSLQNGLDGANRLIDVVGRQHVVGSVVYINSEVTSPGVVVHKQGPKRIVFGELDGGKSDRTNRLNEALVESGATVEHHDNVQVGIWTKFAVIVGYSGLLAMARCKMGTIQADPDSMEVLRGTIDEAIQVGRAKGVPLPQDLTDKHMAFMAGFPAEGISSMERDLAAGRPLEVEALNGSVVRLGREVGVPTPFNLATLAALRPFAKGSQK